MANLLDDIEQLKQQVNDLEKMANKPVKQYYHIKEVSEITGLTHNALKGRYKRKTLDFVREGNCLLLHTDDLTALLDNLNAQRERNKRLNKRG